MKVKSFPVLSCFVPKGCQLHNRENWTSAFLPGVFQGTYVETEGTNKELIPNLTRDDITTGSQARTSGSHSNVEQTASDTAAWR